MLPTPSTSHISPTHIYEPAEDSFLLLDTLSAPSETAFLTSRFASPHPAPLVLELGSGSGVVTAFLTAHAKVILGTSAILTAAGDVNEFACAATATTVRRAGAEHGGTLGLFLGAVRGDLAGAWRRGVVDVVVFNPPYVPTAEVPVLDALPDGKESVGRDAVFERDAHLLELSYAGGKDGMETTDRLIDGLPGVLSLRGCAYILLCAQNKPEDVKARIRGFGSQWRVETVGSSGKQAGWEKLQIIRIWRDHDQDREAA